MPVINALPFPVFKPAMRVITAITNSFPAVVTTSFANSYIDGLICRLYIPVGFGMQEANQLQGEIIILTPTTFSIDIDTRYFDPFVVPAENPGHFFTPAQVTNVGERNDMLTGAVKNVLPY